MGHLSSAGFVDLDSVGPCCAEFLGHLLVSEVLCPFCSELVIGLERWGVFDGYPPWLVDPPNTEHHLPVL